MDSSVNIEQSIKKIRARWNAKPEFAVILGTGLGAFVDGITIEASFPYSELPGFCATTAIGHAGEFVCGRVDSVPVVVLRGRTHCYEGVPRSQITFPVHVLKKLGVEQLLVSCAAGGLSPSFDAGDIMVIDDQIDFLFSIEAGGDSFRHETVTEKYDQRMKNLLMEFSRQQNIPLRHGTYISVTGPNYETRSEMRFYRKIADAIGMSTVPEVDLACRLGIKVCGLATITNLCNPDALTIADGEHVEHVASSTEPKFRKLVLNLIQQLAVQR